MLSRLTQHALRRTLSTSESLMEDLRRITRVPLCTPLEGEFAAKLRTEMDYVPFDSKMSTLKSKIRVASEPHYGDYCSVGVAIESGCRFESGYPLGISHLVEKLAFGSTSRHSSRDEIYAVLQQNGGLIDCQSTRDTFIYAASCHVTGLDAVMEVIANAVWRAQNTPEEIEEAKLIVQYEIDDMPKKIESTEPLVTNWLHMAAFRDNTLGFSKFSTEDGLQKITREHVNSYMSQYHAPERIVVAGVGVDHDAMVAAVERHFGAGTAMWDRNPEVLLPELPQVDRSVAQYTGGEMRIQKDLSTLTIGTPYPNLAHVALGFEGVSYKDPDFVAFCILHMLLGGGGSFSAGGPGKGMYTRLYTEVMNRFHWIYGATAYNHSYADAGLFCVHASSDPEQINDVLIIVLDQFFKLLKGVEKEELERAKIQLKSQLMMNLEIRPVMFEDLSRQVIGHGYRRKPQEYLEKIESVTGDDIVRIAEGMLSGRPSLVGYGDIGKLVSYEALDEAVAHRRLQSLVSRKKASGW
ncbi:Mitochondrial-processing peptidase subunit alpha [Trichostrongylus colubriformis]|uniref:Alpha-MPP n=1 Tax=Trichostrongylus colubriformis TaxID=6319 RepID=A0AAN8FQD8_TRICO